uniref:Protein kinase domain-containing protein n=1 Tax=Sus scrofa TaxID=9823 RepID=A0A8D0UF34_PIG
AKQCSQQAASPSQPPSVSCGTGSIPLHAMGAAKKREKILAFCDCWGLSKQGLGWGSSNGSFPSSFHRTGNLRIYLQRTYDTLKALQERDHRGQKCKVPHHISILVQRDGMRKVTSCLLLVSQCKKGQESGTRLGQRGRESMNERQEVEEVLRRVGPAIAFYHEVGAGSQRDLQPDFLLLQTQRKESVTQLTTFHAVKEISPNELQGPCSTAYFNSFPKCQGPENRHRGCHSWSLGFILYIKLCPFPPNYNNDSWSLSPGGAPHTGLGEYKQPTPEWAAVTHPYSQALRDILLRDPKERLVIQKPLQHPWQQCSTRVPSAPLWGAQLLQEAKDHKWDKVTRQRQARLGTWDVALWKQRGTESRTESLEALDSRRGAQAGRGRASQGRSSQ